MVDKGKITFTPNDITVERPNGDSIELYWNEEDHFRIHVGLENKQKYSQLQLICLSEKILDLIKQQNND